MGKPSFSFSIFKRFNATTWSARMENIIEDDLYRVIMSKQSKSDGKLKTRVAFSPKILSKQKY